MKVHVDTIIEVNKDDLIEAMTWDVAREIIEFYAHYGEKREEIIDILSFDDSELFEMLGDTSINRHIAANIRYYDATIILDNEIIKLKEKLQKLQENKAAIFNNKQDMKRFFCDLLDLSYHVDKGTIINEIKKTF